MPSRLVANTVEPEDLGVANAAQQMVAMIGTVAGIQVLSTIQGGSDAPGPFTAAYLVGGAVAVIGVVAAAFVRSFDLGYATTGTSTDSRTGTLAFYEGLGMTVREHYTHYALDL